MSQKENAQKSREVFQANHPGHADQSVHGHKGKGGGTSTGGKPVTLLESVKENFRKAAAAGSGDDVIHHGNSTFVVFRKPNLTVWVKQHGAKYTNVYAWDGEPSAPFPT